MAVAVAQRPLGALGRIGIVVAMHLVALLVFAKSFGLTTVALVPPPMETTVIDQRRPDDPPPPPPDYRPEPNQFARVPEPLPVPLPDNLDESITAVIAPPDEVPVERGSAVPLPQIVGVRADSRYPLTQPAYPSELIRLGKEGVVDVEVFVNASGRVADARIFRSSGFSAFDRATLDEARRKWRFQPATRDGAPYAEWHRLRVVFKLKNP